MTKPNKSKRDKRDEAAERVATVRRLFWGAAYRKGITFRAVAKEAGVKVGVVVRWAEQNAEDVPKEEVLSEQIAWAILALNGRMP